MLFCVKPCQCFPLVLRVSAAHGAETAAPPCKACKETRSVIHSGTAAAAAARVRSQPSQRQGAGSVGVESREKLWQFFIRQRWNKPPLCQVFLPPLPPSLLAPHSRCLNLSISTSLFLPLSTLVKVAPHLKSNLSVNHSHLGPSSWGLGWEMLHFNKEHTPCCCCLVWVLLSFVLGCDRVDLGLG